MDADKSVNRWVTFEVVDYSQTLSNVSKPILLLCRSVILRTKFGLKCFFPFLQASKSVSLISSTKHNFLSLESSLLLSYIRSAIQVNDSFNFLWIIFSEFLSSSSVFSGSAFGPILTCRLENKMIIIFIIKWMMERGNEKGKEKINKSTK